MSDMKKCDLCGAVYEPGWPKSASVDMGKAEVEVYLYAHATVYPRDGGISMNDLCRACRLKVVREAFSPAVEQAMAMQYEEAGNE